MEGLNGSGGTNAGTAAGEGNLADQVVSSALRYRAQAPLLESLLEEIGIDGTTANGLVKGVVAQTTPEKDPVDVDAS